MEAVLCRYRKSTSTTIGSGMRYETTSADARRMRQVPINGGTWAT
jgi:hypothetical protein